VVFTYNYTQINQDRAKQTPYTITKNTAIIKITK